MSIARVLSVIQGIGVYGMFQYAQKHNDGKVPVLDTRNILVYHQPSYTLQILQITSLL